MVGSPSSPTSVPVCIHQPRAEWKTGRTGSGGPPCGHSKWRAPAHGPCQAPSRQARTSTVLPCTELTVQGRREALNPCHINRAHCKYGEVLTWTKTGARESGWEWKGLFESQVRWDLEEEVMSAQERRGWDTGSGGNSSPRNNRDKGPRQGRTRYKNQ